MNIPLLRGRKLNAADHAGTQPVCVVDQAFADLYWPGQDPIGKRLVFGAVFDPEHAATIVGVVGSTKQTALTENEPMGMVYFPFAQFNSSWFFLVMRTPVSPAAMATTVRQVIRELDPALVVGEIMPMQDRLDDSLVSRRSPAILAALFAGVALLLAGIGTYGVLAYTVSQRRREIGIRMALGAQRQQILIRFAASGIRVLVGGCVLGVFGAWVAGRAMQRFLFEVTPFSPLILASVAAVMGAVSLVAIGLPAWRAAKTDPLTTLRSE